MIAKLKGLVDSVGVDWAVIDVGGVGYMVFCSSRTLSALPQPGEAVTMSVETHVREDHIHLYGFATASERDAFLLVPKVLPYLQLPHLQPLHLVPLRLPVVLVL